MFFGNCRKIVCCFAILFCFDLTVTGCGSFTEYYTTPSMPLIEGIGDEVTVLVTCLVVLAVAVIAWTSTHVNVRTHTSVVIIDRERFGELIRRVRGIAVRSSFADNIDANNASNAAEAHTTTDSLLVSGAAANDVDNLTPDYSHGEGVDSEETCLPERETSSLPQKADDMLQSESESSVTSNKNCSETALPHRVATATAVTADNENILQHNTDGSGDTSGDSIQVRLQFVDGRQRTVVASPDDTIGHFKRYDSWCDVTYYATKFSTFKIFGLNIICNVINVNEYYFSFIFFLAHDSI